MLSALVQIKRVSYSHAHDVLYRCPLMPILRTSKEAVAYIRVSTEKQGEEGIGLEAQRASIRAYADAAGIHIIEWFKDVASGRGEKNLEAREGLQNALKLAATQNADILVYGLDRLSRLSKTIEHIVRDKKVMIVSVSESLTRDPLVMASRAARAEAEGDAISQRTREALQKKKAAGVPLGNRTNLAEAQKLGAQSNKHRADAKAAEIAEAIHEHRWEDLAVPALVEALNGIGLTSGRQKPWTAAALRRPLAKARGLTRENESAHYDGNAQYGVF